VTADRELIWVDRAGRATAVEPGWTLTPVGNGGLALSPDQTSIAVDVRPADGGSELWIKQIGGPFTRLGRGWRPSWSVDGRSVLYLSDVQGPSFDIWTRRADGSGDQELVLDLDDPLAEARRSIAGDWLVVRKLNPIFDVFAIRPGVDTVPVPLIATDFAESSISLSPNDRFLAYVSNSSGRPEVYVRPFPNVDEARIQVSTDGGVEPVWAHSGRELFYKNQSRELIAVAVNTDDAFQVLGREPLFLLPLGASVFSAYAQYDVTRDGQRFLMFRSTGGVGEGEVDRYIVVENFQEELLARVQN
jgi:serine/threonine-protein kinase